MNTSIVKAVLGFVATLAIVASAHAAGNKRAITDTVFVDCSNELLQDAIDGYVTVDRLVRFVVSGQCDEDIEIISDGVSIFSNYWWNNFPDSQVSAIVDPLALTDIITSILAKNVRNVNIVGMQLTGNGQFGIQYDNSSGRIADNYVNGASVIFTKGSVGTFLRNRIESTDEYFGGLEIVNGSVGRGFYNHFEGGKFGALLAVNSGTYKGDGDQIYEAGCFPNGAACGGDNRDTDDDQGAIALGRMGNIEIRNDPRVTSGVTPNPFEGQPQRIIGSIHVEDLSYIRIRDFTIIDSSIWAHSNSVVFIRKKDLADGMEIPEDLIFGYFDLTCENGAVNFAGFCEPDFNFDFPFPLP